MQNCTYLKPETGASITDLETKIVETLLNLHLDMGLHKPDEALFRMFELAFPLATDKEKEEFTKIQGAMRCINSLIRQNREDFLLMLQEQQDYKNDYDEKKHALP